jgi:anti-sigma factor RsiW
MTACPDKALLLGALIDGELDAANVQALERHLATCHACTDELARIQTLRERLRAPGVAPQAPRGLRQRIEADLAREARRRRPGLRAVAPWTVSGLMTALAASFALVAFHPAAGGLEDELVADHIRSTLASHIVDVETSDRHTVKPWFNGKLDFAPPVADLADVGFPLVGGRLEYVKDRPAAALVYRRNHHLINLFVWPSRPGPSLPPTQASRQGYSVQHWRQGGLEFWAVSDAEPHDLARFREAYAARTKPQSAA